MAFSSDVFHSAFYFTANFAFGQRWQSKSFAMGRQNISVSGCFFL